MDLGPEGDDDGLQAGCSGRIPWQFSPPIGRADFRLGICDRACAHRQMTNSPGAAGLNNVTQSCLAQGCQNPSSFLFYDDLHPTNAGRRILKDQVLDAID